MAKKFSRRFVIFSGLAAAGGLAVGYALMPFSTLDRARKIAGKPGESLITAWVRIAPDNSVTVIVPHSEMGQGVHTALPMMLAEELDADWNLVRMEQAPADKAFANGALARAFLSGDMSLPAFLSGTTDFAARKISEMMNLQITGGSTAVRMTGVAGMRRTGAAAKAMLIRATAESWGVPESEIETKLSRLSHAKSGRTATYGEMAAKAASYDAPVDAPLKAKANYTIVGTAKPRFDIPDKVTGKALFGSDIRLPGLVFAAVMNSPVFGGTLKSVDEKPALAVKDVLRVLPLKSAVIVVAKNSWAARMGLEALKPVWDDGAHATVSTASIWAAMEAAIAKGEFSTDHEDGEPDKAIAGASKVIEASYRVPYLAHACMEPMNATAWIKDGKLEIWSGLQDGLGAQAAAAKMAGMAQDDVIIHHVAMGGGFGRKAFTLSHVAQAIEAAMAVGGPVQLAWSREEDMTQGFYREASVAKLKAGLTADGKIAGFVHSFAERHDPPDATQLAYATDGMAARYVKDLNPIPWGPWRSVDHTQHGFYLESFVDELAHAAGQDPFEFRRAHLANAPRHKAVLEKAAAMAGWGTPAPAGRARGIALREAFGTIVAQVAEVSVGDDGRARVHAMWTAADPGEVINPATFKAQMEGGAIYGITAALFGAITIEKGRAVERNFHEYEMLRMADAPRHEVAVIESGAKTGGAGEPGTAPAAAAVANAVFALTGKRIRELPLRLYDLRSGAKLARA